MAVLGSYGVQKDWNIVRMHSRHHTKWNELIKWQCFVKARNTLITAKRLFWTMHVCSFECPQNVNENNKKERLIQFWWILRDSFVLPKFDFMVYVTFWPLTYEIRSSIQIISVHLRLPQFNFIDSKDKRASYEFTSEKWHTVCVRFVKYLIIYGNLHCPERLCIFQVFRPNLDMNRRDVFMLYGLWVINALIR